MEKVAPQKFWGKIASHAGRIPFLDKLVAVWYAAIDRKTPLRVKAILFGAIAYFILPFDMIPDFIVGLGMTDDLAVLLAAIRSVGPHITDEHRKKAKLKLGRKTVSGSSG